MSWTEVFAVLVVSHLVGDFVAQTEWQAVHKYGGLGHAALPRSALFGHVLTYTLAFAPAFVWLGAELGAGRAAELAALVAIPHLVQDDGRLLTLYMRRVKRSGQGPGESVFVNVDQSLHVLTLFGTALLAVA